MPLTFSELKKLLDIPDASLYHFLKRLDEHKLVLKTEWGVYRSTFKIPFYYILKGLKSLTYIGLLGYRDSREEPEPITAKKILEKNNVTIERGYIITTKEAEQDWADKDLDGYTVVYVTKEELLCIPKIENKICRIVEEEEKESPMILDCTSLTKTATIAMYNVAKKYLLPLIYVYEHTKELYWVISTEDIKSELKEIFSRG